MDIAQYLSVVWKWKWLILAALVICVGLSYWADRNSPKLYKATTTLMVGQSLRNPNPTGPDLQVSQTLAATYAQVLPQNQSVLQSAIDAAHADMDWHGLAGKLNASAKNQLLQIEVVDSDPEQAKNLADAIAQQLIEQGPPQPRSNVAQSDFVDKQLSLLQGNIENGQKQINQLQSQLAQNPSAEVTQNIVREIAAVQDKVDAWQSSYVRLLTYTSSDTRTNYLAVLEPATTPGAPFSPQMSRDLLIAAALGIALAIGAAFLIEYIDDSIKSTEDTERLLHLPTVGLISRMAKNDRKANLLLWTQPGSRPSALTEEYRILRTNLQFSGLGTLLDRLLITSAEPGEGKTTIACNLALALAQSGKRVILCDADLRRPSVHSLFGLDNRSGLTTLLSNDQLVVDDVLAPIAVPELLVLRSGPLPPNPADWLASESMKARLREMQQLADVIVLDSPSVLGIADASVLAGLASGVLLVLAEGKTRTRHVRQAATTLTQSGSQLLGVVLNMHRGENVGAVYQSYAVALPSGRPAHETLTA